MILYSISTADIKTVAISYFDNTSGTKEYDPLSKGLADMLITDLSNVKSLKIVEREKLESLLKEIELGDGKFIDPNTAQKLGKGLGAGYMLTGSFLIMGETMRIDARLVDVGTGEITMAEEITGEKDTFFELEKSLVDKLVTTFDIVLSKSEQRRVKKVQTESFEAFNAFASAIDAFDRKEYDTSKKLFEKATEFDEDYDIAWERLDSIVDNLEKLLKIKKLNISSDVIIKIDNLINNDKASCNEFNQMFSFYENRLSEVILFISKQLESYADDIDEYVPTNEKNNMLMSIINGEQKITEQELLNPNPFNKKLKTINDYLKELESFSNDFFKMIRYIDQKEFDLDLCDEYENNPLKVLGDYATSDIKWVLSKVLYLEVFTSQELFLSAFNSEKESFTKSIDDFIIYYGEKYLKNFPYENNERKIKFISDAIERKKNHQHVYHDAKWFIRNTKNPVSILLNFLGDGVSIKLDDDVKEPIPESYGSGLFNIREIYCGSYQNIKCEDLNRIKKIFINTDIKIRLDNIKTNYVGGCPEIYSVDNREIGLVDGIAYKIGEKKPFSGNYHKVDSLLRDTIKYIKHFNFVDKIRPNDRWIRSKDIGDSFKKLYYISERGEYKDGKKEGIHEYQNRTFFKNGSHINLFSRGYYSNGLKDGKWIYGHGDRNNAIIKELILSNGDLIDFDHSVLDSSFYANPIPEKFGKMHKYLQGDHSLYEDYSKTAPLDHDHYSGSSYWDTKEAHSFLDSLYNIKNLENQITEYFALKELNSFPEKTYAQILTRLMKNHSITKTKKPIHVKFLYENNGQNYFMSKPFNGVAFTTSYNAKSSEFECKNGLIDGYYYEWYTASFNEKVVGQYEKGLMTGKWTYFYKNGKKKATGIFINGDGSNKSELTMIPKNGRDGEWTFWYDSKTRWMEGGVMEVSNYKNGKLNGSSILYHENGQKKEESTFIDDKKNGYSKWWYENGNILREGKYKDDNQTGRWIIYNKDGSIKEEKVF